MKKKTVFSSQKSHFFMDITFAFFFLRIETSIIKTPMKKNGILVKKSLGSPGSDR